MIGFLVNQSGLYAWRAFYSGDDYNNSASTACGDELTLKVATNRLPPKPPGFVRDFFLASTGLDKDADFHCELGYLVEPLPWHGMSDQLYGRQARPEIDGNAWINKYNTRWVGPLTLNREKRAAVRAADVSSAAGSEGK